MKHSVLESKWFSWLVVTVAFASLVGGVYSNELYLSYAHHNSDFSECLATNINTYRKAGRVELAAIVAEQANASKVILAVANAKTHADVVVALRNFKLDESILEQDRKKLPPPPDATEACK